MIIIERKIIVIFIAKGDLSIGNLDILTAYIKKLVNLWFVVIVESMIKEHLKNSLVRKLLDTGATDATGRKIYIGDYLDFIGDGMVFGTRENGQVLIKNGILMVNDWKLFGENPDGVHNHSSVYFSESYIV